jgi:hypothetical protein
MIVHDHVQYDSFNGRGLHTHGIVIFVTTLKMFGARRAATAWKALWKSCWQRPPGLSIIAPSLPCIRGVLVLALVYKRYNKSPAASFGRPTGGPSHARSNKSAGEQQQRARAHQQISTNLLLQSQLHNYANTAGIDDEGTAMNLETRFNNLDFREHNAGMFKDGHGHKDPQRQRGAYYLEKFRTTLQKI